MLTYVHLPDEHTHVYGTPVTQHNIPIYLYPLLLTTDYDVDDSVHDSPPVSAGYLIFYGFGK